MDNSSKKNVPNIRFPYFTGSWEQRKFSDVFVGLQNNTLSRADLNYDQGDIKNVHYGDVLIKFGEYIDAASAELPYINDSSIESKFAKSLLKNGDIIIADTAEDETVGKCCEITNSDGMKLLSGLHTIAVRPQQKYASKFLGYYLNSNAYHSQLLPLMQGIKVTSISKGALQDTVLTVPVSLDEQEKIGECLSHIDDIISLHQRKCDELKVYKKGLLQQMFPQPGEAIPRVRIPGFTDPWEQRKFKDLFRERREKTTVEDEDILLSCAITGIYLNSELFGHQRGRSNIGYLKIKMNDLILSAQNLHLGNANVNKRFEHGIISPAYKVYEITDCYPDFIQAWVKEESTKKFFLDVTTEGASQCRKNIDWNMLANSTIPVPSEREQSVLGSFITVLDNAITLHQRKCDELKLYKKGLLQKMFV